jgi:TnpA family transposase
VRHLQASAVDDVLDLFDVLMATNLLARAERTSRTEQVRSLPALAKAAGTVARAVTALLAAAEDDPQAPIGAVWAKMDQLAPRQEVQAAADQVLEQLPSDSDADQAWRAELVKRYGVVRLFLPSLVEAIGLDATADGRPVLAALRRLPELAGRKKVNAAEVDTGLLAGSWRRLVLAAAGLEPGTIDRKASAMCVLEFVHVAGGDARLEDLPVTVAALLTSQACNIGLVPVTRSDIPALTRVRLSHVDQNYLRAETLRAANARLINYQASIPLTRMWGGGQVASVDGLRFVVPVATIHACPNPRYFGRRRGSTWLNAVNDQYSGLGAIVVAGTPRDSPYLLDVLHDQDAGERPETIMTDTGSYSDMTFGLVALTGRRYAPRLADMPDQRFWRIDPATDYGPLNPLARGRVDVAKVARHWPDLLRLAGSIHTGAVRPPDSIRVLSRDGNPTPLGEAVMHYGRLHKSLHMLAFLDDEAYRRDIKAIRNLQEGPSRPGRKDLPRQEGRGLPALPQGNGGPVDRTSAPDCLFCAGCAVIPSR